MYVSNKFPRIPSVNTHEGIYPFLNIALLHVLIRFHALCTRTQTRGRYDRITNVLHCCVQDLTTREGDLLVLFVRSVAVISRVPRRGRPAGSHLPPTLPLPVPAEAPRGGNTAIGFNFAPLHPPPTLMPRAALAEAAAPFPPRSPDVFPLEFKNE